MEISSTTLSFIHSSNQNGSAEHAGVRVSASQQLLSSQSQTNKPIQVDPDDRQMALGRLNKILTQAYEKLSPAAAEGIGKYQANEPLTAEKVAGNILGFIERRLVQDQAEGASSEKLQERLAAGLSGFKKGFAQAEEQLKALAVLSPSIKADLDKTQGLVLQGIDSLQEKLNQGLSLLPAANAPSSTIKSAASETKTQAGLNVKGIPVGVALAAQQTQAVKFDAIDYGRAEARDFRFEVTTKEGDKVTINASASYGANVNRSGNTLTASYSESQAFSLSIEGDLNEEELNSISNLLSKVNTLAEQFYAGDIESAFNQAHNLGLDDNQIAGYALNLSQAIIEVASYEQATTERQAASDQQAKIAPNPLGVEFNPLGDFISNLLDALDEAKQFKEPEQLLQNIAAHFNERPKAIEKPTAAAGSAFEVIENPEKFDDFLARLAKATAQKES
jgi:hypothetical protein